MDDCIIDEIVGKLLDDHISVFCGAGASADATKSQWEDIFTDKTKEFYSLRLSDDIYFLADLESNYYNKEQFRQNIVEKLDQKRDCVSQHIDSILELNLNQIWTTNFDEIIECSVKRKFGFSPTVICTSDDLFLKNINDPYVLYKLNGSVSQPETMVLTKHDFIDYFQKQRLLFEILKRQLVLDSFLFIGYSFKDDLVLNALREILSIFPQRSNWHYRFVCKKTDIAEDARKSEKRNELTQYEQKYYEEMYRIRTIFVDSYSEIDTYLLEIYKRFCEHNIFICGSFRQIDLEQRIMVESITGCLVEALFQKKFNIYSGNGRGLGEIVVAQVDKCIKKGNLGKLVNRPLIFTGDNEKTKKEKNKNIMKDCDTMIILCGQDDSLESSANVWQQFLQFSENSQNRFPVVIPIPCTGYAAEQIYHSDEYQKSLFYQTNRETLSELAQCKAPKTIAQLAVSLIMSYKSNQRNM